MSEFALFYSILRHSNPHYSGIGPWIFAFINLGAEYFRNWLFKLGAISYLGMVRPGRQRERDVRGRRGKGGER